MLNANFFFKSFVIAKNFFFTLILFSKASSFLAQQNEEFEFIGVLRLQDSSLITYKINFKEINNQKIEGYSVTDFYGSEKTKTKIEGFINKDKKTISFFETTNIATKSSADISEFCFVHVKNAKIKSKNNKSIIQGKFTGKFENDTNCMNGTLYLVGTDFLTKPSVNADSAKNAGNLKNENITEMLKKADDLYLTSADVLKLNWSSNDIKLSLWDGSKVDQDKISVIVNDKTILENFVISKEKKVISIPFTEDVCKIVILAVNEGKAPPNTVNILLEDKSNLTPFITKLKTLEKTTIVLNKRKK
jgi:hypothetical protein